MQGASREEGRKYVEAQIEKHPVVLFGRSRCPACVSAKNLLSRYDTDESKKKVHYVFMETLEGSLQYSVSSFLQVSTERNASPFIYIGGTFIGNNVDLRNLAVKKTLGGTIKEAEEKLVPAN